MNNRPEEYLTTNIYYDSKVVGEKRDPQLSFLAYKRGMCDDELVDVTNRHGLYEQHACFLVERSTSGPKVLTEVEGETRAPPPCHRLGGADRAARNQEPRRRLDHGQGKYVGRPAQRAHRTAREDRTAERLRVEREQEPTCSS